MIYSLISIHLLDKLKFVESKEKSTKIYGEFGTDDDGIFVTGFTNIKQVTNQGDKWHTIYYVTYDVYFSDKEANVACREGGYSSGTFVTYEYNRPHYWWLWYIKVGRCTGNEDKLSDCPNYSSYYYDHWYTNVKLKCYI